MVVLDTLSSFVLYAIVFLLTIFLSRFSYNNKILIKTIITSMPCLLLLLFRHGIGSDYYNYERIYGWVLLDADWVQLEPAFYWLVKFSESIGMEYDGFIYITSILTVFLSFYAFHELTPTKNNRWVIFVALCLYFSIWFAAIRQVIAIGLVLCSYRFIKESKLIYFLLFVAIAFLFHKSALVALPCYFLVSHKEIDTSPVSTRRLLLSFVLSLFVIVAFPYFDFAGIAYSHYVGDDSENGRTYMMILLGLMMYPFEVLYMKRLVAEDKFNLLYYYFLIIEFTTFALSTQIAFAFRMGQYFSIAHPILTSKILECEYDKNKKTVLRLSMICVYAFYFLFTVFSLGHNGIMNYKYLIPW